LETTESLVAADTDSAQDVYVKSIAAPQPQAPAGGGVLSSGGAAPVAKDAIAPRLTLGGASTQRVLAQGGVIVVVECDEACSASATGSLSVPGASKVLRLRKVARTLRAGVKTKLKLKLSSKARRAIKRALKKRKRLSAGVVVQVKDVAGNSRSAKRKVKLRR
jgi:hypothetical protein